MTDNCPSCSHGPVDSAATVTDNAQRTDAYRCPICGHTWITRRTTDAYPRTAAA